MCMQQRKKKVGSFTFAGIDTSYQVTATATFMSLFPDLVQHSRPFDM